MKVGRTMKAWRWVGLGPMKPIQRQKIRKSFQAPSMFYGEKLLLEKGRPAFAKASSWILLKEA
jgi:hypothetical protein